MKYLIIFVFLTGCISQKKLAQKCADRFPVQEQIKEIIVIDTIYTKGDTITMGLRDSSFSFVCPPNKTITKTKEVRILTENTAKTHLLKQNHQKEIDDLNDEYRKQIARLNAEMDKHIKEIDKLNNKLESVKKFKRWFYMMLIGIIIIFAIRLRKLFSF